MAYVAIFSGFAAFGLNGVVSKELVKDPGCARVILGSTFIISMVAAAFFYTTMIISVYWFNPQNQLTIIMTAIIGISLFFKTTQAVNYWFESQVNSKVLVWSETGVILSLAIVKLLLAWYQAPLIAFAMAIACEGALLAVVAIKIYDRYEFSPLNWIASFSRIKHLIRQGWPLLISSVAWILYTRIDQIMIGRMIGNEAVGYYTAATRLSDATNILPGLIVASIVPAITVMRERSFNQYVAKFQVAYDIVFATSIALAIVLSLSSASVIQLAFGQAYAQSAIVLSIHAWSIIFVSMAVVSGRFLINEGLQVITMSRHVLGVFVNTGLNYWLIGAYGINGAAIATLTSLIFVNYLVDLLHPATRICFVQKTKSLVMAGAVAHLAGRLTKT